MEILPNPTPFYNQKKEKTNLPLPKVSLEQKQHLKETWNRNQSLDTLSLKMKNRYMNPT